MEFTIMSKHGAYPCEITIDEDNHRYMVRNADTTGEFFNSAEELVAWIDQHWYAEDFQDSQQYQQIVTQLHDYQGYE